MGLLEDFLAGKNITPDQILTELANKPSKAELAALNIQVNTKRILRELGHNLIVTSGSSFTVGGTPFMVEDDVTLNPDLILDVGEIENGKDYRLYLCLNNAQFSWKLSLSEIAPQGFSPETSICVGGYHTLCRSVGDIPNHSLTGLAAGKPLVPSIWDLLHKPTCSPNGMIFQDMRQFGYNYNLWADIYEQSGTGYDTKSVFGATVTTDRQGDLHVYDMMAVGKRLIKDAEFYILAEGSNEKTNVLGSAKKTAGGQVDTADRRMISNNGMESMCGNTWSWSYDVGSGSGGHTALENGKGSPGYSNRILMGGGYGDGAYCGPACRHGDYSRVDVRAYCGGRGCCEVD